MSIKDFLYRVISMFLNSIGFESYISAEVMGQGIFVFLRHAKRKVISVLVSGSGNFSEMLRRVPL